MSVILYHNPRCSKSRQTLALLQEKGTSPDIREYLIDIPTVSEISEILKMLSISPRDLMRKTETVYKENNFNDVSISEDELIKAMIKNPILIERPIVIFNSRAAIGRPPEAVLEIL